MKEYRVCFIQRFYYTVTAEDEDEAIDLAEDKFFRDIQQPRSFFSYDDVEVWENE